MKVEVNLSPAEQVIRMLIALPISIPIVYFGIIPLFFLPVYLCVTGITGVSLEYSLWKAIKEGNSAKSKQPSSKIAKLHS